jgi:hypothetical protein
MQVENPRFMADVLVNFFVSHPLSTPALAAPRLKVPVQNRHTTIPK